MKLWPDSYLEFEVKPKRGKCTLYGQDPDCLGCWMCQQPQEEQETNKEKEKDNECL
jgi:hypothetical protein